MTFRAIFIGLLGAMGLSCFVYFNDWIMQQSFLATNLVPTGVYGLLLAAVLLLNPLLKLLRIGALAGRELAVVAGLMLVACAIPGPGLMWHFSNSVVMPHHYAKIRPGWKKHEVMAYVPPVMLVDADDDNYEQVVSGFKGGLTEQSIDLRRVPWGAWLKTLSFWLPLLGLSFLAGICIVRVVHRQWSSREQLRYPIAYVTSEMIDGWRPGEAGGVFRNRLFWLGFAIPAAVILINGYSRWNLQSINIPMAVPMEAAISTKWPIFRKVPGIWWTLAPTLYFSVVGLAYFVSSQVSFSIGVNAIVYTLAFISLTALGVDVTGGGMEGGRHNFQMFGSYVGLALVILYIGRRFYLSVLARTLCIPTSDHVEPGVVWASRTAIAAAGGMVAILVFMADMDWMLAVLYVAMTGMMYLVLTRISVETGLFMIQAGWGVTSVLLAAAGFAAIGPHMLVILGILSIVIAVDPIVSLMPLAANAIKIGQDQNVRPHSLSRWLVVGVLLALVVGVPVTIGVQYAYGGGQYGWADTVARLPFSLLANELQKLPHDPSVHRGVDLSLVSPNGKFLVSAGVGLVVVLLLSAMRLRFTWWPIHPVLFLIWGTFPGFILGASFLFGWMLKSAITWLGGGMTYRKAKPLFVGLIAGEFAAAMFWTVVGLIYYFVTDLPGPKYQILPA